MKLNWKNIKNLMDEINPYNGKNPDSDAYEKLWNGIRTLCVFNFEEGNTLFFKMVKYDNELYNAAN